MPRGKATPSELDFEAGNAYLKTRTERGRLFQVSAARLYADYRQWIIGISGPHGGIMGAKTFWAVLRRLGVRHGRVGGVMRATGVKLKTEGGDV